MTNDPFADEAQTQAPANTANTNSGPWEDNTVTNTPAADGNKVRVTLKGGTGFDAPWITIDGTSVADALAQITGENANSTKDLIEQVSKVGKFFASKGGGSSSGGGAGNGGNGGQGRQAGKPQGATEAPGGESRHCSHGEMVYKTGVSASGKAWKGFFCPNRDRDNQCKPEFIR